MNTTTQMRFRFYLSMCIFLWLSCLAACTPAKPVIVVATTTSENQPTVTEPASRLIATFTSTPIPPSATATLQATATPDETSTPTPAPTASFILWDEAGDHIGEEITLCGPVMDAHFAESSNGKPTFLNIGEKYPNPARFTIVIWEQDRDKFPGKPEELYTDQEICITGTIEEYDGALEMVVSDPEKIVIQ